jgi:hypothetical protein
MLCSLLSHLSLIRFAPRVLKAFELALAFLLRDPPPFTAADDNQVLEPLVLAWILPKSDLVSLGHDSGIGVGKAAVELLLHHDHSPGTIMEPVAGALFTVGKEVAYLALYCVRKLANAGVNVLFIAWAPAADDT